MQVLNLGVASTCVTKEKSGERSYWATKQYNLAMRSHPHIVVLQVRRALRLSLLSPSPLSHPHIVVLHEAHLPTVSPPVC